MLWEREGGGAIEKPVPGVEMRLKGCVWGGGETRKIVFENAITKLNTSSANFKTKLNK